ncbi:methyltransferase domain-containing protein [Kineosporia succinea]|uniref:Methyltransferase type 11 domain-containing protein n=1 Tax=Kineosporia succinea TaxID=84632 RepID=A0ABT9PD74_9ACTN|nr:methyltransferase domain-containing protein [Kineosporia succinea]MDP9829925.1 hypothetical protein [Kineosporia succinea]
MRSYDDLITEASAADVTGWDFAWLEGRATEERTPWGYAQQLAARLPTASAALDLDTGGGEIIAGVPALPPRTVLTEAWGPNVERLRTRRHAGTGASDAVPTVVPQVVQAATDQLPFADATFDLVTSRHPITPHWHEIARVLTDDGTYFAQHVGPRSAFELIEYFLGPLPHARTARDPQHESAAAHTAGLTVTDLRTARCRMEFHDIGAVVWTLRRCVWWVPDFTVARYEPQLRDLDAQLRAGQPFAAHSTRTLIEARRRPRRSH